ncbi:hypothetical protein C1H76_9538 [Elsinoe australis]|uniref:HNH nuclease domain-containing protein n=1 Tax=Elsinoe australis TaxID=40998 RepID=A0A4U7AP58_9PEZI|nr:hypothetical protein C1H76_9538 [Elsinoe australis]
MASTSHHQLRNPIPLKHDIVERSFVDVEHPGYDDHNIFLRFPALDCDATSEVLGVTFGVLRTACGILADNRWDGYFTRSKSPTGERISLPDHDIIRSGTYYYQLPGYEDGKWPVVPTLQDWRFPHDNLPTLWQNSEQAELLQTWDLPPHRDQTCHLTGSSMISQNAHIVPKEFDSWFQNERLTQYCSDMNTFGFESTDDKTNMLRLRDDLHRAWDTNRFAIVPKSSASSMVAWRIQALDSQVDLVSDFHNRATYIPYRAHIAKFLLARFAIQILKRAAPFFRPDKERLVVRRGLQVPTSLSRADIPELQPKSRSQSPRKRKSPTRLPTETDQLDQELYHAPSSGLYWACRRKRRRAGSDSDSSVDTTSDQDTADDLVYTRCIDLKNTALEEEERGRRRTRLFCE